MKKLMLDDLQVESFVTARGAAMRGTVKGNENTLTWCETEEYGNSCGGWCTGTGTESVRGCTTPPQPTLDGESCNWTCNFRQCASGQEITCDAGTNCGGDTNGLGMC